MKFLSSANELEIDDICRKCGGDIVDCPCTIEWQRNREERIREMAEQTVDKQRIGSMSLTLDMHSVPHNIKFSFNGEMFCKYSVFETFKDIRANVIEELKEQYQLTGFQALSAWMNLEIEKDKEPRSPEGWEGGFASNH